MKSFNDKHYDGISLNIPSWFITMNQLEPEIERLKLALEACRLSIYHPDHLRNLHELQNYKFKKEEIEAAQKAIEVKKKEAQDYREKLINCESYELEWASRKEIFDLNQRESFVYKDIKFDLKDIFTNRSGIKASFKKWFNENIKTVENYKEAALKNCSYGLLNDLQNIDLDWIDFHNQSLYRPNQGFDLLGIGYEKLFIKTNVRSVKDGSNYQYRSMPLVRFNDGSLGYKNGDTEIKLVDFIQIGLKLIRKDK